MNRNISRWTSLANLTKPSQAAARNIIKLWQTLVHRRQGSSVTILARLGSNIGGQIATLLTLVMVIMLVLVLVLVNIGDVSQKATAVSNAADAAVLMLASQLSTKAQQNFEALDNSDELCLKEGLLPIILAVWFAVAAVALTIVTMGGSSPLLVTAVATLVGAVAGAGGAWAGARIQGLTQDQTMDAIGMGAVIGAAIGFSAGLAFTPTAPHVIGTFYGVPFFSTAPILTLGQAISISAGTLGGEIIYKLSRDKMNSDAQKAVAEGLNSLGDRQTIREGVFLSSLSQLVSDPKETSVNFSYDCYDDGGLEVGGDPCDSDADGDTQEIIPWFQFWWDRRVYALKQAHTQIYNIIGNFWMTDHTADNFKNDLLGTLIPGLKRGDISEDGVTLLGGGIVDGVTLEDGTTYISFEDNIASKVYELCYTLEVLHGYDLDFWVNGPTQEQINAWKCCDPDDPVYYPACLEDEFLLGYGYDGLDFAIDKFKYFWIKLYAFMKQGHQALGSSWESWMEQLYEHPTRFPGYVESEDYSIYKTLDRILKGDPDNSIVGMNSWGEQIEDIRVGLLDCIIDPNTGLINNAPCKTSIDEDPSDNEFIEVDILLGNIRNTIETFQQDLFDFDEDVYNAYLAMGELDIGGLNPVRYTWDDSNGKDHSVSVEVSNFPLPTIGDYDAGGNFLSSEHCWFTDKKEDNSGTNTWVKIIREDPSDREVGILGFWKTGRIERTAHAAWSRFDARLID